MALVLVDVIKCMTYNLIKVNREISTLAFFGVFTKKLAYRMRAVE